MATFSKPQSIITMLAVFFALLQLTEALSGAENAPKHVMRTADDILNDQISQVAEELEKRGNNKVVTTGICNSGTRSDGTCNDQGRTSYPRLEIRDLYQNEKQWDLYILAMQQFQRMDFNDPLSYYQIAGIHGRPYKTWNGFPTPLRAAAGFCPHGWSLFGTWHRPYLAIFEQAVYQNMVNIAGKYPQDQQASYMQAAATFRIPYWDWATGPGADGRAVPDLINKPRISVTSPSGPQTIDNPLYSYSWGNSLPSEMGGGPQNSLPRTVRRPYRSGGFFGIGGKIVSDDDGLNDIFNSQWVSLRDRVYSLFASGQPWGAVSTTAIGVQTDLEDNDSFESVHDLVHNSVGGESGGHMFFLEYSAFDPIFWLHHANVDRLLNMYQFISPNTWVADGQVSGPMAQWDIGDELGQYDGLEPFVKNNNNGYYSSNDIKETRVLGYYYPETVNRNANDVIRAINNLYGSDQKKKKRDAPAPTNANDTDSTGQYLGRPLVEGDYHTIMQIIADKHGYNGSYTVHAFLGKNETVPGVNITANSTEISYVKQANYVGSYGILGMIHDGNVNDTKPLITSGSLPLTTALQGKEAAGELKSLKPEDVTPYLAENLSYKIVGQNGLIDPTTLPDFHVSVKTTEVVPSKGADSLPDLSKPYEKLPGATKDLPAGGQFQYAPPANTTGQKMKRGLVKKMDDDCCNKQVVHYVNPRGVFMYSEM